MNLQDPAVDPARLEEDVRRVMERDEFRYDKSWFDHVAEWIAERLDDLLGSGDAGPASSGATFGGGIGAVFAWILIVVAVAAVVAVVVYVVAHRVRRPESDDGPDTEIQVEHRRRATEWAADADRLEAEGDWKGALRARYRQLVRTLVDRRQVPDVAGRTTGELRQDLAVTTPDAAEPFDTASMLFELAWYAQVPTGPDESRRFARAASAVLAATPASRVDEVPAGDSVEVRA